MSLRRLLPTLLGVAAAVAVLAVLGLSGAEPRARAASADQPLPGASQGRCPKPRLQPLSSDAVGRAALAALDQAPMLYRGLKLRGMRVTVSVLARDDDPGRGGYARVRCGRRAQDRTVVVGLEFPAMRPSASLSQGVVLVSRFGGRFRVWAVLH